jgi:hypothetical protein
VNDGLLLVIALSAVALNFLFGYVIMRLSNALFEVKGELQDVTDFEHNKCMGAVMALVGDEWAAQVLDVAAADYASVESQMDRDRIMRLLWHKGGEPVPSIWLRERATRLRIDRDWGSDPVADAAQINFNEVVL